jgi:hypothetical protein
MQKTSVFLDFYCLPNKLALWGYAPVFFGPGTLPRQAGAGWRGAPVSFPRAWYFGSGPRPTRSDLVLQLETSSPPSPD